MPEIKRKPYSIKTNNSGYDEEFVAFDEDHTINDFLRYLLTQTDKEDIQSCLDLLDEE